MHVLKLALNKSMRASDDEQGINKLLDLFPTGKYMFNSNLKISVQMY